MKDSFCEKVEREFDKFSKYHKKILLRYFNAKVGSEDIFKPTVASEILHENDNDNVVRIVNFTTSKNLIVTSSKFPHRNIHKFTWASPDGKIHY
jgi:hypothetical protein